MTQQEKQDWLESLYDRYAKPFWYFLVKVLRDSSLADDIFQESFYRLWRVKPTGLHPAQEKAYLYRTGVRLVIDMKRRNQRTMKVMEKHTIETERKNSLRESPAINIDDLPFERLSLSERTIMWLAYVEEYNHRDIAKIIGSKEGNVKVQLFRVKKKLQDYIKEEEGHAKKINSNELHRVEV